MNDTQKHKRYVAPVLSAAAMMFKPGAELTIWLLG